MVAAVEMKLAHAKLGVGMRINWRISEGIEGRDPWTEWRTKHLSWSRPAPGGW
jgi:hypothetical protein